MSVAVQILLPLLAAVLGSYLTYYFTNRSRRQEAILRFKEEKYARLLVTLKGFVGESHDAATMRAFLEEQYQAWLYSSDDVVRAINRMVRLVADYAGETPPRDEGQQAIGGIVVAMRRDLLGKTKLDYSDFHYTDVRE